MNTAAFISRAARLVPLAALVAAGGCFATRNDVRLVQSDLASMRTEMIKGQAQERDALARVQTTVQAANDSIGAIARTLLLLQGDVRGALRSVNDQLIQVQQLLNQSKASLDRARADAEARDARLAQSMIPAPVPIPGDTTTRVATSPTATPASVLYQSGATNLSRNSITTARAAFQELLATYPNSEYAPQAQLGIGTSYFNERNYLAAQTGWSAVWAKYPDSPAAPTALYKTASMLVNLNRKPEAKVLLEKLVAQYRTADEYEQANDLLKTLR